MPYAVPQVRVFQELADSPTETANTRAAHITGPHAALFRYSDADEKVLADAGSYTPGTEVTKSWPNRPAGANVDYSYVRVFADNALLKYYENLIGVGTAILADTTYPNRVRSATVSFADNGDDYPMSAALGDRGAKVGDPVYVRGVVGSDEYELNTTIRGFVGDAVAATVGTAAAVSTNQVATSYGTSVDSLSSLDNTITLTADGTAYDGLPDGVVEESYVVTVTQSSSAGDLTTAKLRVVSASGLDDDSDVSPAGAGGFTAIGARGLLVEFDSNATTSASSAALDDEIAANDLVVGMSWRVTVRQTFTPVTFASGGTYTGDQDTTYVLEVTKGGVWADEPEISVSTTTGYDAAGPVSFSASGQSMDVGAYGVTFVPTGTGLRKGDKYTIEVTSAAEGPYRTIVLADDLPEEIQGATDLDLKLYIEEDVEISQYKYDDLPNTNWEEEETQVVFDANITAVSSQWTVSGVVTALPVDYADLYIQYRAWLETYVNVIESVASIDEVTEKLGSVTPDNPLAWGVYMAKLNAADTPVYFSAVPDPDDTDSWLDVLGSLEGIDGIYNLVPLSTNSLVQDAFKAHVIAQSAPSVGNWRACVLSVNVPLVGSVVDADKSSDGEVVLATLGDDPNATGTQYTKLSVPAGNAKFQTNGVRAGDVVRYLYGTDGLGNVTYTEFVVDEVISEGTLLLLEGHTVAVPVASKIEIWRTFTPADHATLIAEQVARFGDKRVVCVSNPTLTGGGFEFEGYYGACAIAGLRSGMLPHRPLTRVTVTGVDSMGTAAARLSGTQLDSVSEVGGLWIYKDRSGAVYVRHGITTATDPLGAREESLRSNFDDVSFVYRAAYAPYIGQVTITEDLLQELQYVFRNVTERLSTEKYGNLGPQLTGFDNLEIRQDSVERDRVIINADILMPAPLNNLDLHLQLVI